MIIAWVLRPVKYFDVFRDRSDGLGVSFQFAVLMQRFHHRVLHRIPFAKYAAAFVNRSRSIFTSAG